MPRALPVLLLSALFCCRAIAQEALQEERLAALEAAIADLQGRVSQDRRLRDAEAQALLETEQRIAALVADVSRIEALVISESAQLEQMAEQAGQLRREQAGQQDLVGRYLRSAWLGGRQEYLKLLLNQDDPAAAARLQRYYQYFSRARGERIAEYGATLEELAVVEAAMHASAERLAAEQAELDEQRRELEQQQAHRLALLQDLDRQLADGDAALARLQREHEEMELLIRQLRESIADLALGEQQADFADLRGQLPAPVQGSLLRGFGASRARGDLNWEGVLIAAAEGAPVRAVHHGRVVFADWFGSSGLLLIIDHGGGYMSLYAHNQALYSEVGDWVTGGSTVAAVGNSGGQAESALFFQIRKDGKALNPADWCRL